MTASDPQTAKKVSLRRILTAARRPVTRYRPAVIAAGLGGVALLVGAGFFLAFGSTRPKAAADPRPASQEAAAPPSELDERLPASYSDPGARPGQAELPATDPLGTPAAIPERPQAPAPGTDRADQEPLAAQSSPALFTGAGAVPALPAVPTPLDRTAGEAEAPADLSRQERFVAAAGVKVQAFVAALPRPPLSALEVKAGTVIPAALVTGLNSDLPGPVIAQVTEPVFDHQTGKFLLIPAGARLIGKYDSQVAYGQGRALVVWTRLIFPDGRSMDLGAMLGADPSGAGGLQDQVDIHGPRLARAIGLSTLLSIGGAVAQNSLNRGGEGLVLRDAAGGLSASASQVGQRLVDRNLQRPPTLRVRPGWPVRVIVDRDLILAP